MPKGSIASGDWGEYISNLTEEQEESYLICHECGDYIEETQYWEIGGRILCDDCARLIYQRWRKEI